jgi:mRNA interferase MazF
VNQGDLVWVRFPFSDLQRGNVRPALVVSNDAYNAGHEDLVICAVTSNLAPSPTKVPLAATDLVQGRLPVASMVRADKILQVERGLLGPSFAHLTDEAFDRVSDVIARLVRREKR